MDKDQKLVDDISALLREAGYGSLVVAKDHGGILLNATRGPGGVVMRLAPTMMKVGRRVESGAAEVQARRLDVGVVPKMEGLVEQIRANPALAKALEIPPDHLSFIM